ncbi:MAG: hypothetical protein MUC47_03105 [Candidatus Kapabacteria bacterium]|nr:hypothetical protein [Candidatus Kapabacteria bacterium]
MNRSLVVLILLVGLACTAVDAQERRRRQAMPDADTDQTEHLEEKREAMRDRIEGLRKVKIMDLLLLEGEQVERFFAVYNPLQRSVYEAKDAVDAAVRDLVAADRSNADDAALTAKAAVVSEKQKALIAAVEARERGIKPVLNARQYARYIGFEAGFMDELQRMILRRLKR